MVLRYKLSMLAIHLSDAIDRLVNQRKALSACTVSPEGPHLAAPNPLTLLRILDLAVMEDPPLRVVIGSDAYKGITQKLEDYKKNYTRFEELSKSTDVEE